MKYGFVYIWYDKKHKRYYVGCHWGTEDDGYICSSTWMRNSYNRRPNDFKRRILTRTYIREKVFQLEDHYLNMIKQHELGTRYYNLQKHWRHWTEKEETRLAVSEKLSLANKGRKKPLRTEQHCKNISIAKKGIPNPFFTEYNKNNKGKPKSEETKLKMRRAVRSDEFKQNLTKVNTGRKHTEESKWKMTIAKLFRDVRIT
jgi:hypothetical protein